MPSTDFSGMLQSFLMQCGGSAMTNIFGERAHSDAQGVEDVVELHGVVSVGRSSSLESSSAAYCSIESASIHRLAVALSELQRSSMSARDAREELRVRKPSWPRRRARRSMPAIRNFRVIETTCGVSRRIPDFIARGATGGERGHLEVAFFAVASPRGCRATLPTHP